MGNKIVTEADRKRTPAPTPLPGFVLPTAGRGQRSSLERGRHCLLYTSPSPRD